MMKKMRIILFFVFALFVTGASAQSVKRMVRKGNSAYEKNDFSNAEVKYKKALDKKPNYYKGKFNLGDAYYQEKNFKDADSLFSEVAATAKSAGDRSKAWYNKGNSLLQQHQYEKSIEAYKKSLLLAPADSAAKYNLEYARKKLKKQKQQQKQQKKNQKNKKKNQKKNKQDKNNKKKNNKKKNDKKKNDKQKNQKKKNQDKKQQQQQNQKKEKGKKGQQKQQKQKAKPRQISKQEAKRMLNALKNGEKKTLKKLQLQKAKAAHHKTKVIDW